MHARNEQRGGNRRAESLRVGKKDVETSLCLRLLGVLVQFATLNGSVESFLKEC